MGLNDYKINSFSKPVSALDDTPQMSASELKEWFDSNSTNELKQSVNGIIEELKDVDVSKQHTHDNKDILDNITEEPIYNAPEDGKLYARKDGAWSEFGDIPSISSDELDNFTDGVCRVKGDKYFDGESFFDSIYTIESENYALCIAHCEYEGDSWDYYQTLIFGSGQMYTRYKNDRYVWDENDENYGNLVYGEWGEWQHVKAREAYIADRATQDAKENVIADTYATKDEVVGQKTEFGEIFNDYENNKAFSPFSHSAGYNTKAGMRGFFYSNIEFGEDNDVITLSDMQNYGTDTDTDLSEIIAQYPTDSYISMVNGNKFYNCAKIVSTSGNTITVEKLPFDAITNISDPDVDDWSLWVEASPDIGVAPLGYYAHADGENSVALERASHAEGRDNVAYGQYAHVEGRNNRAAYTGHAEGRDNVASGETSHAQGRKTVASGKFSHSQGYGTIAAGESQHVQGKYNIEDTNNEFAHIVGNGIVPSKRSNAHTLDWKGNAWYAGDVVAGDVSLKALNDTCATKEELTTAIQQAVLDSWEVAV